MRKLITKRLDKEESDEVGALYQKYEWYITQVATYISHICKIPVEDLKQEGFFGLVKAKERYDPERASFLTYAKYWIRLAIYSYACSFQYPLSFPANFYSIYSKYMDMKRDGMSEKDISKSLDLPVARISKIAKSIQSVKGAVSIGVANANGCVNDLIDNDDPINRFCDDHDSDGFMSRAKEVISEQEYFVLNHLYALECSQPKTLAWLGRILKVTKERVRQIKNAALNKIKLMIEEEKADRG